MSTKEKDPATFIVCWFARGKRAGDDNENGFEDDIATENIMQKLT